MLFTQSNLKQCVKEELKVSHQGGAPNDQVELAQQPSTNQGRCIWHGHGRSESTGNYGHKWPRAPNHLSLLIGFPILLSLRL